jgi:hypothetical protein
MPSEVFGFAATRIEPAGYRTVSRFALAEHRAHETTAS